MASHARRPHAQAHLRADNGNRPCLRARAHYLNRSTAHCPVPALWHPSRSEQKPSPIEWRAGIVSLPRPICARKPPGAQQSPLLHARAGCGPIMEGCGPIVEIAAPPPMSVIARIARASSLGMEASARFSKRCLRKSIVEKGRDAVSARAMTWSDPSLRSK
jgi:hypothetical protein